MDFSYQARLGDRCREAARSVRSGLLARRYLVPPPAVDISMTFMTYERNKYSLLKTRLGLDADS
jgi:hypothetical protein